MASEPNNVLLVEDNPGDARLLHEMLKDVQGAQFNLTDVARLQDALELLRGQSFDIVLLDLRLPDSQGFDTFTRMSSEFPNVPIVVMTGLQDETVALRAVQEGAQDYLVKGQVDGEQLARSLRYAIVRHAAQRVRQESVATKRGRILGLWGAKGGVGTTTVALNVASALKCKRQECDCDGTQVCLWHILGPVVREPDRQSQPTRRYGARAHRPKGIGRMSFSFGRRRPGVVRPTES